MITHMVEQAHHILTAADLGIGSLETVSQKSFALYIRALLQNWRQGTVACKDRSKVTSRSNKKPWKQKGTGRARAGSPRSPLWRGGGVVFGPQPRVRTLKVSQELRKGVMRTILDNILTNGRIVVLDWMPAANTAPKTAEAVRALSTAKVLEDKKILFFTESFDHQVHSSFANIENVYMILYDQPNAYALSSAQTWVVLKKDLELFKQMIAAWN
jgi:large subunit ribosomal protein L4